MPSTSLLQDLIAEVNQLTERDIHPKVEGLVSAFLNYLGEPRYQTPLSLSELKSLFDEFEEDLNALVFYIYTQSNTNKRSLLKKSNVFKSDPKTFDYLNAIANYSSSSIKLSQRSDFSALYQLRIFGFYKFLTIIKTIELAHSKLYSFISSPGSVPLYEKVLRFDSKDLEISTLLSEKISLLRRLNLPIHTFFETENSQDSSSVLLKALSSLEDEENIYSNEIQHAFNRLAKAQTPASKLTEIVAIQSQVMQLCSSCDGVDVSKMSNDELLPALIYVIIKYSPQEFEDDSYELYLYINFVKIFWKPINFQRINPSRFTLNSTLFSYNPMDRRVVRGKKSQERSLATLLNLVEPAEHAEPAETAESVDSQLHIIPELSSDQALLTFIHKKYLNQGELQFSLTNCEAILYFLSDTPIVGIASQNTTIPDEILENQISQVSLHEIVEQKEHETKANSSKNLDKLLQEEVDHGGRSRSSSLFNTISSAVTQSVNRSRSNSGNKIDIFGEKGVFPLATDPEASLKQNQSTSDVYGLGRVRSIFDKIGPGSHLQQKHSEVDSDNSQDAESMPERNPDNHQCQRSQSFLDRLSPNMNRTRSSSLEHLRNAQNTSLRRATLTSKFSTGVSELMTKISSAANTAASSSVNAANSATASLAHNSSGSVHTIEDPFDDGTCGARGSIGPRSSSLQTMEKWFCNIPENPPNEVPAGQRSNASISSNRFDTCGSNCNEGSVFSSSFGELTKYHLTDFDSMTINDLKTLKVYYDQLCCEVFAKTGSKSSHEYLPEVAKDTTSTDSSLGTGKSG